MIILNKSDAIEEYKKSNYLTRMANDEITLRIKSIHSFYPMLQSIKDLLTLYTNLVDNFTEEEIQVLSYYHKLSAYRFRDKLPALCPNVSQIKYIKLKLNVDWNYPYTINNCVVLPQKIVNEMIQELANLAMRKVGHGPTGEEWNVTRKDYKHVNHYANILCHEWIHIIQRYPTRKIYETLISIYTTLWGFFPKNANKQQEKEQMNKKYPSRITNPDGFNDQWQIIVGNHTYTPILSLNNETQMPIGFLINNQTGVWTNLHHSLQYVDKFYGLKGQLYHPNEIFAHLVADYVILNKIYTACWDSSKFYDYLNAFV